MKIHDDKVEEENRDNLIHLLKTESKVISHDIKVIFRDNEDYMRNNSINGLFIPNVPFKVNLYPDFQKELKYTNLILVPKNKRILFLGESKDGFDTIIAPETEFEIVEELDDFTTVWKIGKQPFYDISNDLEDDFKYWFSKASDLVKKGKIEESIKYLDKAIELNPTEALLWYIKGKVLIDLNRCEEAIELLDKSFDLNHLHVKSLATKGIAYEELGKYDDAMVCYDDAIILDPNDAYAYGLKGTLLLIGFKDYNNAIKYLNQAKRINPNNSMLWNNLGDAYLNIGEFEKGLDCCKKARSIDPSNFRAWFTTGEIYYELDEYDKALDYALKAKEINPLDSDLLIFIEKIKEAKKY